MFLEGEAGVVYTHSQRPTVQEKLLLWINAAQQQAQRDQQRHTEGAAASDGYSQC